MKKKKIIILSILVIAVIGLAVLLVLKGKKDEKDTTSYKDVKVSTMTIENTLTSSGEVTSDTIELGLNTTRKYKTIYFSEGSYIASGAKY